MIASVSLLVPFQAYYLKAGPSTSDVPVLVYIPLPTSSHTKSYRVKIYPRIRTLASMTASKGEENSSERPEI